ncbi:MAG: hypothetical protein JXB62_19545 [Pirellulales bacterium]|nr:hypothetical protein [Pirellulales bacterium]
MTAYPEKVDVESVFHQMQTPQAQAPRRQQRCAEGATRPWRVVSADGSTSVLDPAACTERLDERPPAESRQRLFCLRPEPSEEDLRSPPASARANIGMPIAAPRVSQVLLAVGGNGLHQATGSSGLCGARRLGAAMVVQSGGSCRSTPGATRGPDSAPARGPTSGPVIPPQQGTRCREIDSQLARIIGIWPKLPRSIQAAILAMVDAEKSNR